MKYFALLLMVLFLLCLAFLCLVKSDLIRNAAMRSIAPGNPYFGFVRGRNYIFVIRLIGATCLAVSLFLAFFALYKIL